jgi:galactonate dehydratase
MPHDSADASQAPEQPRKPVDGEAPADPAARPKPAVAITEILAHAVQEPVGRRVYVVVIVKTDAGISGVGEVTVSADHRTAAAAILRRKTDLIGRDATTVELVRQIFLCAAGGRPDESAAAQGAVNMALLDIAGRLANAPVYDMLGGPTRNKVRALAWLGEPPGPNELLAEVVRARDAGFRAMVVPLRIPDSPTRGRGFYRQAVAALESLRSAAGDDLDFVLDCGGQLPPAIASALARELEPFHLLWLDEPVGETDRKALARISAETVTPLGFGRTARDNQEFLELLRSDAIDTLRPDIGRHGITSIRKAAALAETYYVGMAPFHRGGPIATAAAMHAAASIANFVIQEIPFPANDADRKMRRALAIESVESVRDGFLSLPTGPGLGISINDEALREYQLKS